MVDLLLLSMTNQLWWNFVCLLLEKCRGKSSEQPRVEESIKHISGGLNREWATLLGTEMCIHKGFNISLTDAEASMISRLEPTMVLDAFMELQSRALVLGQHLGTTLVKETIEREKLEAELFELKCKMRDLSIKKESLEKERFKLSSSLKSWKNRCFQAKEKERNVRRELMDISVARVEEQHVREKTSQELVELQRYILAEHEEGFHKVLQRAALLFGIPVNYEPNDNLDTLGGNLAPITIIVKRE